MMRRQDGTNVPAITVTSSANAPAKTNAETTAMTNS